MLLRLEEKAQFKPMPETEGITWWKTKCSKAKCCLCPDTHSLTSSERGKTSVTVNIPHFKGVEGENVGYDVDSSHLISEKKMCQCTRTIC